MCKPRNKGGKVSGKQSFASTKSSFSRADRVSIVSATCCKSYQKDYTPATESRYHQDCVNPYGTDGKKGKNKLNGKGSCNCITTSKKRNDAASSFSTSNKPQRPSISNRSSFIETEYRVRQTSVYDDDIPSIYTIGSTRPSTSSGRDVDGLHGDAFRQGKIGSTFHDDANRDAISKSLLYDTGNDRKNKTDIGNNREPGSYKQPRDYDTEHDREKGRHKQPRDYDTEYDREKSSHKQLRDYDTEQDREKGSHKQPRYYDTEYDREKSSHKRPRDYDTEHDREKGSHKQPRDYDTDYDREKSSHKQPRDYDTDYDREKSSHKQPRDYDTDYDREKSGHKQPWDYDTDYDQEKSGHKQPRDYDTDYDREKSSHKQPWDYDTHYDREKSGHKQPRDYDTGRDREKGSHKQPQAYGTEGPREKGRHKQPRDYDTKHHRGQSGHGQSNGNRGRSTRRSSNARNMVTTSLIGFIIMILLIRSAYLAQCSASKESLKETMLKNENEQEKEWCQMH